MTAELITPEDLRHTVQFYESDGYLVDVITRYVGDGLRRGDACVVCASEPHRRALRTRLDALGDDVADAARTDRLIVVDARETLRQFMTADDRLDRERWRRAVDEVVAGCRPAPGGRIRAYGEMVDVLWGDGRPAVALELEALWNQVARPLGLDVLCAYSLARFRTAGDAAGLARICDAHSHVKPAERYAGVDDAELRRREIVRLQQRALALDAEVSRREAVERELTLREDDLRDLVENAVLGMHWVGPDGCILWANRAELAMLGYTRDEYVGRHLGDVHVDRAVVDDILARLARNDTVTEVEARLRCKDGSVRHVLIDANVWWRDGALVHTRCFTRDVTERKRAHDALAYLHGVTESLSAASTLDEVLDILIGEGVAAIGASSGAVFLVDRAAGALDVLRARGDAPGDLERTRRLPLTMRAPITDCVRDERAIYVESGGRPSDSDHAGVDTTGAEARVALPMVASRRVIGALEFSFDAHHVFDAHERVFLDALAKQGAQAVDRARLFESERAARQAAEAADRRKDEFLAMLGHELRNPLAPIRTALELLRMRGVDGDREQQVIERQVRHLSRLVDDLLDVSRITRGTVELDRRPLEIASVVAKAVEMATPLFEQRAHELVVDVPRHGLVVSGDPVRLAQVVSNLLTNAARYTAPGGHVHVDARGDGAEVVLRVRDDGIGMAPELLPRVFDLFVQGERPRDRQQGGLGLGLALARNLTELHGGSIGAASDGVGQGSTFTVRLPWLAHQGGARSPRPLPRLASPGHRLRILVIDDNVDAAELIAEVLGAIGHDVSLAHDGPAAIAAAAELEPDAALVDIGLPVMDGFEVAARLRELLPGPLRLVAVTGYGQESDKARTRAAGFDEHLTKPVGLEALMTSLAIAAPRRGR